MQEVQKHSFSSPYIMRRQEGLVILIASIG